MTFVGVRGDGSFYSSCYGSPNSADIPFAGSTNLGAALDLYSDHAGKSPTFVQWGGSASAWPPLAFDTAAATRADVEGMFSMYDWGTSLAGLNAILAGTATAHSYLGTLAVAMVAFDRPILFRPLWEMNGTWFDWGRQNFSAADYITIWRNIWQVFADVAGGHAAGSGLGTDTANVTFFWCPNNFGGSIPDPTDRFPGAAYADAIGWDGYIGTAHFGTTYKTPAELYGDIYDAVALLDPDLPIVIGEWGVGADLASPGKAAFFTAMLDPSTGWVADHPRIAALNYFNDNTYETTTNKSLCFEQDALGCPSTNPTAPQAAYAAALADAMYDGSIVNGITFPDGAKVPFVSVGGGSSDPGGGGGGGGGTGGGGGAGVLVYSPPWRFLVTDLDTRTLTFLDRFATKRSLLFELNAPATARGEVPADEPEINIVHDDGDPFLEEGNRLLYAFRRETGSPPWVCRFAGPILQTNDVVRQDQPATSFSAFDPWQVLFRRPVRDEDGNLAGRTGLQFPGTAGNVIALDLLARTIAEDGGCFIDAGVAYGGTAFYGGTIETTSEIDASFQQAANVGDAWKQLCDTGTLDIVLTPIYDPINRPGYCAEVSVYEIAGSRRNGAIFAWDLPSRNLTEIDRLNDGTQRANIVQPYLQEGYEGTAAIDVASIAKYGTYWEGQTFSGDITYAEVEALALERLAVRKNGSTTIQVSPAPDFSAVPFVEYFLGDLIPVYATKRFRRAISAGVVSGGMWSRLARVYKIPIDISDNSTELVQALEFSSDDGGDLGS